MRKLRVAFMIIVMLLYASGSLLRAQTYQFEWNVPVAVGTAWCLNHEIAGSWTYHVIIHVDRQTGIVDRMHNNVLHYDLVDMTTGEKLVMIDTGNETNGWDFAWWNSVLGTNFTLPAQLPDEGYLVAPAFKFISKGGVKFSWRLLFQVHRNASGEIKVDFNKSVYDCNW